MFTGRATAFINSPGIRRLVAGAFGAAVLRFRATGGFRAGLVTWGRLGSAGLTVAGLTAGFCAGLAFPVIAPGLRPLGLAMTPPMRASRAVCVGRLLPTGVLNRPPLEVAPWPWLVNRPQLSRL